ncbi:MULTISPECIES: hypothetical protein [Calothrix]|uniref:Uncharacterized protein n=2 Tax=Calothrix TaxID=1186 RepID=A0ABR8A694_9CYAN|nr:MULTISPECIES: hypothetical protein [Calothrix]MBD2195354.1 hypothetical protein [Calothrix parietina FACHB-288]MBD2223953.1 hypothetical protein [Calothrix anomala FACHB-343]
MIFLQTVIFDVLTTIWVVMLFVIVFIWLPSKVFIFPDKMSWASRIVGSWSRIVLVTLFGVWLLSALHLFSWFTLVFLYGGCFLLRWLHHHNWRFRKQLQLINQRVGCIVLDALDQGFLPKIRQGWQRILQFGKEELAMVEKLIAIALSQNILEVLLLAVILTFAVLLRFEHPLRELRFGNPDSYGVLLATRQIIAGDWPGQIHSFPTLSTLASVLSLLGAVDAMQVIRFLNPLLGCLLVLSVGYSLGVISQNRTAGFGAMYSLGAYLFTSHLELSQVTPLWLQQWLTTVTESLNSSLIRQWAGGNLEIGAIFLVLGLARGWEASRSLHRRDAVIDTVCCLTIVAIAKPTLLVLALIGGMSFFFAGRIALTVMTTSWILLALVSALPENPLGWESSFLVTLPVGLSWLWGLMLIPVSWLLSLVLGLWSEITCLILVFAIAVNFLLPNPPKLSYLEYEIAARKTLELRARFPIKRWLIVAPVEQLAESYGAGWYEDLGLFVEKYAAKVSNPDFHFRYSVENMFILVEKRPLVTGISENYTLPYSVLSDPTYRNYRSSAGRASLEFTALQLCETYRHLHEKDVAIYYEDRDLRIYQIQVPEDQLPK